MSRGTDRTGYQLTPRLVARGRIVGTLATAAGLAATLVSCGGGSPKPETLPKTQRVDGAWVNARGPVTYCTDVSTATPARLARAAAAAARREGLIVTLRDTSGDTAEQYRRFAEHPERCDVFDADVIWTARLATRGLVRDLSQYVQPRRPEFFASTLRTACYAQHYWAVPRSTNAGFLFYRKGPGRPPQTWQDVYETAGFHNLLYQAAENESLTVNYLELAFAAGGRVLSHDGTTATVNSEPNRRALQLMVESLKRQTAPASVTGHSEQDSLHAFQDGTATYMRNWPDSYEALLRSGVDFGIAPFPLFAGAGVAGVLGGANLVISNEARHADTALALIRFLTDERWQAQGLEQYIPAVLRTLYSFPGPRQAAARARAIALRRKLGNGSLAQGTAFLTNLRQAVQQSRPRPITPYYADISQVISHEIHEALIRPNDVTPKEALDKAQSAINTALKNAGAAGRCKQ